MRHQARPDRLAALEDTTMTLITRRIAQAALVLLVTAGAGTASHLYAQNTNPGPPPFMGRGMIGPGGPMGPLEMLLGRAAERLGLTDAQTSQIKAIADAHRTEIETLMRNVGSARRALIAAQLNGQSDDQIRQLSAGVAAAEADMAVAHAHIAAEVMQLLTPEQQTQVKQFVAQIGERGPRGHGRGRGN
jgi:Spy/CpxP family protein refolding chaperone